jgi:hypothetical protein
MERPFAAAGLGCACLLTACGGGSFAPGAPDGSAPADAMPLEAASAEAGSWCSTQSKLFCADFDETDQVMDVLLKWSSYSQSGGTFALANSPSNPSPPNALSVTSSTGGTTLVVQGISLAGKTFTRLHLEFDFRVDKVPTVDLLATGAFAAIGFDPGALTDSAVAVAVGSLGKSLELVYSQPDAGQGGFRASGGAFPTLGVWSGRLAVEIEYSAAGPCAQLYQGVVPALSPCLPLPPTTFAKPSTIAIALGFVSIGNASGASLEFDNVTFEAD